MKKTIFLLTSIMVSSLLSAQQMPLEFSDPLENFIGFAGSSFSFRSDPNDPSNQVGEFFNAGQDPFQGCFLDLARVVDLDEQQTISLSFYAFDPNPHTVTLKLENGTNEDVQVTMNTSSAGWTHDLTFDFGNAILSSDGTPISASGTYSRVVIFIDIATSTTGTYLIDNIDDGTESVDPNEIDVAYDVLVWSDEFDTNGPIDDSKWFHQTQLPNGPGSSWFNGEIQHYTDRLDNSFVEDGFLHIAAKRETFTDQEATKEFTSARLNSKFAFTYGRVDVRAKLPLGDGTWPAIWTLGKNVDELGAFWQTQGFGTTGWPACGEIDIMEHGLGAVNHVSSAIHTPSSFGATVNFRSRQISDVAENFHVYSVNWSPNQITFLIDGEGYYTYNPPVKDNSTWPFDLDQYLLLNVAMGGIAGPVVASFNESSMIIDYVRVYQSEPLSTLDVADNVSVNIFPNPTPGIVTVTSEEERINELTLFDTFGKKILTQSVQQQSHRIDLSGMVKGVYFLHLSVGDQLTVKRLIVQ